MSKNKDKLNSSNTLFNYFAKSPATPKIKQVSGSSNLGTPVSSSNGGTPKVIKQEKVTPSPAAKDKPLNGIDDEDEDEIQPMKKRRRIVMMDDEDGDSDSENRQKNDKTPPKAELLTSFKRVEKDEASESPVQKKVKKEADDVAEGKPDLADLGAEEDKGASVLDEPTVWAHQKLDFLKPEKIKDIQGNRPSSEKYDSRTLYVPESFLGTLTPVSLMSHFYQL